MKRTARIRIASLRIASLLLLAALSSNAIAQNKGNTPAFVTGGVGLDEIAQLSAVSSQYSLKLVFALKAGNYLADVAVTVKDAKGGKIIDTVTQGPWLLAKVPPGAYTVTATFDGKPVTQSTTVKANARREVVFRWDRDVAEAGEPLTPAPEEAATPAPKAKPMAKTKANAQAKSRKGHARR
mgnify:CR=1 FL=1